MKKTNLVLLIVVIVLVLLIAGWGIWKWSAGSQYSAVYLTTGDLYFGKLVHFPNYGMEQVHTVQVNQQNKENPLSIQKFENMFWGPGDFLNLNRDKVVWSAELDSKGQMAQFLRRSSDLSRQSQQPQQPRQPQQPQSQSQIPSGKNQIPAGGTQGQ